MFKPLRPDDTILHRPPFTNEESRYSIIPFYLQRRKQPVLPQRSGNLIFTQTPGYQAWVWVNERLEAARIRAARRIG